MHAVLDRLDAGNRRCEEAARRFRDDLAAGRADDDTFARLKQEYPWYGHLPCRAAGVDFVLYHAHDDVVAWNYLWKGDDAFEPAVVRAWVEWSRESTFAVDVGAYTGLMSLLAGLVNPAIRVEAFEPVGLPRQRAALNLRLNGVERNVNLRGAAASDEAGATEIKLFRPPTFLGTGSSIDDKPGRQVVASTPIRRVVVDEQFPRWRPDLVKIDVEGHELAVLRGMRRTIERSRPRMLVEVWDATAAQTLGLLDELGYDVEIIDEVTDDVANYRAVPR